MCGGALLVEGGGRRRTESVRWRNLSLLMINRAGCGDFEEKRVLPSGVSWRD